MKNQSQQPSHAKVKKLNSFLFEGKRVRTWMTKEQFSNAKQISNSFKEPVREEFRMGGDTEKIQNMRTSLHLFPSFARKEMDEQGNASLSNCCYHEQRCGCTIIGNGTLQNPLSIQYCKKHKAIK